MLTFLRILLWIPLNILFPSRIYGKKNAKQKGRLIFCACHKSNIDVLSHELKIPGKSYVLTKKELFKFKPFGFVLKCCGAIKVDRDTADIGVLKTCIKLLGRNKKLLIFPEGTRNKTEKPLLELKPGVALIAIKTRAPIVPVAYVRKSAKPFHMTYVLYGEPFELSEFYDKKPTKELIAEAENLIAQRMIENLQNLKNLRENHKKSEKIVKKTQKN